MALTDEQSQQIKEHLLKQLDNFPEDKRNQIKEQVNSMTPDQLENFVKQNQLTHLGDQCIFCSIVAGKMPSYRIAENTNNISILEINPLSKGHALIVPRKHIDKVGSSTQDLAKEVSEELREKFNPQTITSKEINIMGHPLIEITPIYGGEAERRQATEDELKALQEEILKEKKPEPEAEPEGIKTPEELFKMPSRIPR